MFRKIQGSFTIKRLVLGIIFPDFKENVCICGGKGETMAERNTGKKWAKRLLRGLLICGGTVVCAVACCLIYIIATAPKLASVDVTP